MLTYYQQVANKPGDSSASSDVRPAEIWGESQINVTEYQMRILKPSMDSAHWFTGDSLTILLLSLVAGGVSVRLLINVNNVPLSLLVAVVLSLLMSIMCPRRCCRWCFCWAAVMQTTWTSEQVLWIQLNLANLLISALTALTRTKEQQSPHKSCARLVEARSA